MTFRFFLVFVTTFLAQTLWAVTQTSAPKSPPLATWQETDSRLTILLDMTNLLSAEQREIVNSGFSTFTILTVSEKQSKPQDSLPEMRLVCRVKYDTWEEKYVTTKIHPTPMDTIIGSNIQSWSEPCLSYRINDPNMIQRMSDGGRLFITLQVRQSSQDESTKIKDWLVKQQSGLMQGLYSHMLGDLRLGGKTEITMEIPPGPAKPAQKTIPINPRK